MISSNVYGKQSTIRRELQEPVVAVEILETSIEVESFSVLKSAVADFLDGNITKDDLESVFNSI